MTLTAEVYVNIQVSSLDKPFTYLVPESMNYIQIGCRVLVPFGARYMEGFILGLSESENTENLKSIIEVVDDSPWFDAEMLETAKWITEQYICTLPDALRLFIPGKTAIKTDYIYYINTTVENIKSFCHIAEFIDVGYAIQSELIKKYGSNILKELSGLVKNKILIRQPKTFKTNQPLKFKQIEAVKTIDSEAAKKMLCNKPAQSKLYELLLKQGPLLLKELPNYHINSNTARELVKSGAAIFTTLNVRRDSYKNVKASICPVELNNYQQNAVNQITATIDAGEYQTYLLFGVTGSGKTEVYLRAAEKASLLGKQTIVLVPEIALTSQIVRRFKAYFGDEVVVVHSKLNKRERADSFERLRCGQAKICIGARSAIFAPCYELGLIIIDEEHEFTYKQEEYPHYHAREIALKRASLKNAVLVLGSATPSIESYYNASQNIYKLLTMPIRADHAELPSVKIVDMREELKMGRRSVISNELNNLISNTLEKNEQIILLLNRRGYSTFVLCRECGYVMKCPNCSVPLVYHQQYLELKCHYCEHTERAPEICPVCSSRYIKYFGTGTQKVEQELAMLYPNAKIARMDQDTTKKKFATDEILKTFSQGKYDILLGTQMVAKGHDIKNVTAVGTISADTALNLPDFRAAERTFALLTQAAGRAGRGEKKGGVVVQTYNPEHYAVECAAKHDYVSFYASEIEFRRELDYPPFKNLIKFTVSSSDEKTAWQKAKIVAELLEKSLLADTCQVIGPFSPPIAKVKNIYRINIIIKTDSISEVRKVIIDNELEQKHDISIDVNPINVL